MTREPIYAALAALFAGLGGGATFRLVTRDPKHWADCPREETPALLIRPEVETCTARKGLPRLWSIDLKVLVYVFPDGETGAEALNPLLDAIERAIPIEDPRAGACTLGGLVSSVNLSGPTELHLGTLDGEAVAILSLRIVVPG